MSKCTAGKKKKISVVRALKSNNTKVKVVNIMAHTISGRAKNPKPIPRWHMAKSRK